MRCWLVGEDADDFGASLDLFVETFKRIRAELGAMLRGELDVRQYVVLLSSISAASFGQRGRS